MADPLEELYKQHKVPSTVSYVQRWILIDLKSLQETYFPHLSFSSSEIIVDKEEGLRKLENQYVKYK